MASAKNAQSKGRIAIAGVSERDIDLLLLEEFQSSPSFLEWFVVSVLGTDKSGMHFVSARRSVRYAFGEIDLEIAIAHPSGDETRLLIENKVNAGFQPRQAERYRDSGDSYVSRKRGMSFHTVLLAPKRYFGGDSSAKGFDATLTYESILNWFDKADELGQRRHYKMALLASAIEKGISGYQPVEDAPVGEFWLAYYAMASRDGWELEMSKPAGKPSGAGFIYFRPRKALPPGFEICHKFKKGFVDLHIKGWGSRLGELEHMLNAHFRPDMKTAKAGRSVAIRLHAPKLDPGRPFSEQEAKARIGLDSAKALLGWFIEKQQYFPQPLLRPARTKARN